MLTLTLLWNLRRPRLNHPYFCGFWLCFRSGGPRTPRDHRVGAPKDWGEGMTQSAASASGAPVANGESAETGARVSDSSQFISFAIGGDQYGVDIMAVREIKGWSQITQLPRQPD